MASPILQFKRGNYSNLPGLQAGEPALTVDKFDLYVGIDSTTGANKLIGSHRYWTRETTTAGSGVNLVEGSNNGSNKVTIKAPASVTSDVTYTMPGAAVNHGFLKSDASGNLSWDSGAGIQAGVVPLLAVDIDGATATTTVVDADLLVIDDGANGTNRKVTATTLKDYFLGGGAGANFTAINVSGISTLAQADASTLKVSGISTFTGTVDINGAIDADGGANIAGGLVANSAAISDLTSGRVVLAGTSGELEDNGNLTFNGSTLAVTGAATVSTTLGVTGESTLASATVSDLTDNRIVIAGTGGALEDSNKLTFDGSTLAVTGAATVSTTLGVTGETTLASATVSDLTDNRVVIAGTSGSLEDSGNLTFDGSTLAVTGNLTASNGATITGAETTLSSATVSDLTDNRVVIAGTSGALEDSGNLTFDGSTLGLTGALTASGTVTTNGAFVANGNVDLGNATSDTITPTGRFDAALVPATDGAIDLGTSTLEYKDLYIDGTAHIDTLDVDINATVAGTLGVTGETTLASATVSDLTDNRVVIAGTSGALEDSGNLTFDGSTLTVTGAETVTGNVTVGGNLDINGSAHDIAGQLTLANPPRNSDGGVIAQVGAIKATGHAGLVTAFKFTGNGIDTYTVSGGVAHVATTGVAATTFTTSQIVTASQGQTAFTFAAGYTDGFMDCYLNGSRLITGTDYTQTDTNTVTLASGATVGDELEMVAFKSLGDIVNIGSVNVIDNLTVSGITTQTGLLDANGGAKIDNIQIGITGDNEIDTSSGNLTIDSAGGTTTVDDNLVVSGNLTVNGTQTIINSTTVSIDDKNFQVATGAADDAAANGAGFTVDSGDGDKTWNFEATGDNWGSSENINLATGKVLKVNNTSVLSATTLGSSVVNSSLTVLGTIATGVWQGTAINDDYIDTINNANKVQLSALDIDGGTDVGADLVDADEIIVDDGGGGTNRRSDLTRVKKYIYSAASGDATASDSGAITLSASGVSAGSVGSSTAIPIITVDAKGRVTNTSSTAIDQTSIAQGNSNVAVVDTGTGTATVTIDGSTNSTFAAAGLTLAMGSFNGSGAGLSAGTTPISTIDIDGGTATTTMVDADLMIVDDGANGTNRKITAANMKNYFLGGGAGANFTAINVSGITTAGELDATTLKVSGISTFTGTVDVNGAIDADGGANIAGGLVANSAAISDLTSGRVVLAGTSGELEDSNKLTFDGTTLALTGAATVSTTLGVSGETTLASAIISDLTDNRVLIAGTSGAVEDSGNLTFDGSTLNVTGAVTASGTLTANGNVDLGNATSDTITATGRFDSDLVPSSDDARDLGTSALQWKDLYVDGTADIDTISAESTTTTMLTVNYDATLANVDINGGAIDGTNIGASSAGTGAFTTLTASGNVDLGDATSDTITATGRFDSDIVPSTDNARDLGASGLEFKDLYLDGTANIDALVADTAKISDLTSGRVVLAGTSGEVEDSGNLTFNGSTLAVTGNITSNSGATLTGGETTLSSATVSDLTDNRVVLAGSAGALEDSNNLTFDGSTLAVTGAATVSSNLTISGNLTVNGTTSSVNTVNTTIEDTLLDLQVVDGGALSSDTNKDVGIVMNYYSGSAKKAAVYWDDSAGRFVFSAVATESAGVLTNSTAGALEVGSLYLNDCAGNEQVISCSGTTRSLDNITIDGGTF